MSKIYLTSDLHLGHDREFVWGPRGFKSIDEMNEAIISRWNGTVGAEDDVYVLGDLCLGPHENVDLIAKLNGKLHIVLGNHDTPIRREMYRSLSNVVEVEWAIMLDYRKYHFFMTHFPCMTGNLEKESLKQMTLNLYGHTHQKTNFYEDRPYMYHVGCDSHDCTPVLLNDIIQEMEGKVKECIDFLDVVKQPTFPDIDAYCGDCEKRNNCRGPSLEDGCPPEIYQPDKVETMRCEKCVYNNYFCGYTDYNGDCPLYKRDPPDGGYYE